MNKLQLYFQTLTNIKYINYEGCRHIKRWVAPTQKEITKRKKKLPPQVEPHRNNFIEWNRNAEIYAFNERLSEKFNTEKLNQAFIHKSYIVEEVKKQKEIGIKEPLFNIQSNEEFIKKGKEITSAVIKKYLNQNLSSLPENGIIAFHDYLMSQELLATASLHIGTKDIILTGEHPVSQETLAQTFLALVGALAESVDVNHAGIFVRDFLIAGLASKDLTEIWCPTKPFETLTDMIFVGFGQTIAEAKDVAAINILSQMYGLLHSSQPLRFNEKINIFLRDRHLMNPMNHIRS